MNTNDYQPVSCELHSELELAIMHHEQIVLSWKHDDDLVKETVNPVDVITRDKQEFLVCKINDTTKEIRLDKISSFHKT